MKQLVTYILIASLCLAFSCGGNKLKSNEKTLGQQILTKEKQRADEEIIRAEREQQLTDSIAKLLQGFRFKEDRSVDLQHPPVVS